MITPYPGQITPGGGAAGMNNTPGIVFTPGANPTHYYAPTST